MVSARESAAEREARAERVDRVAEQILARLAPLHFEAVRSSAERDAVLRMRYEVMVDMGWVRREDYPDRRASDEYDEAATFVVAREGEQMLGNIRVVLPSPGRPLPVEQEFGIRVRPAGEVFEAGRLVVPRERRPGRSHLVLAGLCARAWLEARALGCLAVVSTASSEIIELYRGLGMRIVVLGPPRSYWGEQRVPIEITASGQ